MINITKQTPNVDKDVEKEENLYTAGQKKISEFTVFLKIYYMIQLYHFLVYIHRDLRVSQRFLFIHVYCDTIHNNPDMKPIYISINK